MKLFHLCCLCLLLMSPVLAQETTDGRSQMLSLLAGANINDEDRALILANGDQFSPEQLGAIYDFLTDPRVIADAVWFDVSRYQSWDEYNYFRPVSDVIFGNLARRDLFLDPARQLNNPALTNMSAEALAALAFAQAYVEEKWDHEVPWDGRESNAIFNWVHPDVIGTPNLLRYVRGGNDPLYTLRAEYWWSTYWSLPASLAVQFGFGRGTDTDEVLNGLRSPNPNSPRLAGYAYPLGNQLFVQTAESAIWYADYLRVGTARYGEFMPQPLDTGIDVSIGATALLTDLNAPATLPDRLANAPEFTTQYPELWRLLNVPFAATLRTELTHPETAAFWNVMRFVHAGARQREGGASPERPENGQPAVIALRYDERTPQPVGRPAEAISAFSLLTTVYSDSLLLDFTNWNDEQGTLIHQLADASRSDGIHRQVSERNKAIYVIEQMGNEQVYPNATHVSGSRGLGLSLTTVYAHVNGDFLPYTAEEASALVRALTIEASDYGVEASRETLCQSPLLRAGYEFYAIQDAGTFVAWAEATRGLCT